MRGLEKTYSYPNSSKNIFINFFVNAPNERLKHVLRRHKLDPERWEHYVSPYPCLVIDTDRSILSLVDNNGWRCKTSSGFRGPGRKADHCPYANLIALKALAENHKLRDSDEVQKGVDAQLEHWINRGGRKIYLFGIGTTFRRLKYPHVWYDILHVLDALSKIPYAHEDTRFTEMLDNVNRKQLDDCSFKPESVWKAYRDWSFGQKKASSPWMTFKVALINSRLFEKSMRIDPSIDRAR